MNVEHWSQKSLTWSRRLVMSFSLIAVGMAPLLWVPMREFPIVGLLPIDLPWFVHAILLLPFLGGMLAMENPRLRKGGYAFHLLGFVLLFLLDIHRLTPYHFMYTGMLGALAFQIKGDRMRNKQVLDVLRWIVLSTYFWSAIWKFNPYFLAAFLPDIFMAFGLENTGIPAQAAIAIPILELGLALGLAFPQTRKPALIGSIVMHGLILLVLSPLGMDWNSTVWAWNVFMMLNNIVLFGQKDARSVWNILEWKFAPAKWILIILFGFLPILNWFGLWDHYLSASLYSYRTHFAEIQLEPDAANFYYTDMEAFSTANDTMVSINLTRWAEVSMNSLPYPQPWVYKRAFEQFQQEHPNCRGRLFIYSAYSRETVEWGMD